MKNLKVIGITLMLAISITGMAANFKMFRKKKKDSGTSTAKTVPATRKANPASVYCEKQGGKSIIVKGSKGEYGVCQLRDGTTVEEWEYYKQHNTPQSLESEIIKGTPNPAAKFCVDKGGQSVTVKDRKGNERGVCKFKNGTQIDEWDYYRQNN